MGPLIGTKSQLWLMDGKNPWAQVETCHTGVKRAQVVLKGAPGSPRAKSPTLCGASFLTDVETITGMESHKVVRSIIDVYIGSMVDMYTV